MTEEIKPCPFCGGNEVREVIKVNQLHKVELFSVCCWNCGGESGVSGIREGAIQKWNQRPYDFDMPAIVKKVQELQEKNKELQKQVGYYRVQIEKVSTNWGV